MKYYVLLKKSPNVLVNKECDIVLTTPHEKEVDNYLDNVNKQFQKWVEQTQKVLQQRAEWIVENANPDEWGADTVLATPKANIEKLGLPYFYDNDGQKQPWARNLNLPPRPPTESPYHYLALTTEVPTPGLWDVIKAYFKRK